MKLTDGKAQSLIAGFSDYVMLREISEVGIDFSERKIV
jgi:hypothetical protein